MPYLNLDLDYFDHPKTKRLIGLLGRGAEVLPLRLWAYCGKHHCADGRLAGYSGQEIESLVNWWGKSGEMIDAMKRVSFISKQGDGWEVCSWQEHQGHLAAFKVRARAAADARWKAIRDATSIPQAVLKSCLAHTPLEGGKVSEGKGEEAFMAKRRIAKLFNVNPESVWGNDAEVAMCSLIRSQDFFAELEKIEKAWPKRDELFLSKSPRKLLLDWPDNVAKASVKKESVRCF